MGYRRIQYDEVVHGASVVEVSVVEEVVAKVGVAVGNGIVELRYCDRYIQSGVLVEVESGRGDAIVQRDDHVRPGAGRHEHMAVVLTTACGAAAVLGVVDVVRSG